MNMKLLLIVSGGIIGGSLGWSAGQFGEAGNWAMVCLEIALFSIWFNLMFWIFWIPDTLRRGMSGLFLVLIKGMTKEQAIAEVEAYFRKLEEAQIDDQKK